MYITNIIIGWEVSGTFDCGISFKNLCLIAKIKKIDTFENYKVRNLKELYLFMLYIKALI